MSNPEKVAASIITVIKMALAAKITPLEARIAELEQSLLASANGSGMMRAGVEIVGLKARIDRLEECPALRYLGVWRDDAHYQPGSAVTLAGSVWITNKATTARPGNGQTPWTLAVKAGRDAR